MNARLLITSRSFARTDPNPLLILREAGVEVVRMGETFSQEEFNRVIPEFDALIIGAHPFPPEVLEHCPKLKIICKYGVGLDNVPLNKARELGVRVCNAPGANSNAVADLAFALMLATARGVLPAAERLRRGEHIVTVGTDVFGKTLGLVGFGAIGRCVARRASGFSMRVLAYDPYLKDVGEEFRGRVELCSLDDVIARSDILSIHVPLNNETRYLIDRSRLSRMKKGAILINTARGGVVDEKVLVEFLRSGYLAGAGLDVTETEPIPPDSPLLQMDNVVITPHMGMHSREAMNAVGMICTRNVLACLKGGELTHCVV